MQWPGRRLWSCRDVLCPVGVKGLFLLLWCLIRKKEKREKTTPNKTTQGKKAGPATSTPSAHGDLLIAVLGAPDPVGKCQLQSHCVLLQSQRAAAWL